MTLPAEGKDGNWKIARELYDSLETTWEDGDMVSSDDQKPMTDRDIANIKAALDQKDMEWAEKVKSSLANEQSAYIISVKALDEKITRLESELKETKSKLEVIEPNYRHYQLEAKKLEADLNRANEALRKARGTLGYGSLNTTESTIKAVRDILDEAIALNPEGKKES